MTRLKQTLNMTAPAPPQSVTPIVTNAAGGASYALDNKTALVRLLMTGLTGNTFYQKEQALAHEFIQLVREVTLADPEFVAKAIVYAREQGYMRTAPILALVVFGRADVPGNLNKRLYEVIYPRVVKTLGDLQDVIQIERQGRDNGAKISGNGKPTVRAARAWLAGVTEYQVIKYGSALQEFNLRDILRLKHPQQLGHPTDDSMLRHVLEKGPVNAEVFPQYAGYAALKALAAADAPEEALLALVAKHRLPWEVVTGHLKPSARTWDAMLHQMPLYAILRNLGNLAEHGALSGEYAENLAYVRAKFTNIVAMQNAMIQPFRFLGAQDEIEHRIQKGKITRDLGKQIIDMLNAAVEVGFASYPMDLGDTFIATDVSGSMENKIGPHSKLGCEDLAGMLTALLVKGNSRATDTATFGNRADYVRVAKAESVRAIAKKFQNQNTGTALHTAITLALVEPKRVYQTLIFVTDDMSWQGELQGHRPGATTSLGRIQAYRAHHPESQFVFVNVQPYQHSPVPVNEPNCWFIAGWSDRALDAIRWIAQGQSQLDQVQAVELFPEPVLESETGSVA